MTSKNIGLCASQRYSVVLRGGFGVNGATSLAQFGKRNQPVGWSYAKKDKCTEVDGVGRIVSQEARLPTVVAPMRRLSVDAAEAQQQIVSRCASPHVLGLSSALRWHGVG